MFRLNRNKQKTNRNRPLFWYDGPNYVTWSPAIYTAKKVSDFPVMSRTFFYSVGLSVPIVWNYGHDDIIHDTPLIFRPVSACYRYRGHDDVTRSRRRRWSEGHSRRWWVPSWVMFWYLDVRNFLLLTLKRSEFFPIFCSFFLGSMFFVYFLDILESSWSHC